MPVGWIFMAMKFGKIVSVTSSLVYWSFNELMVKFVDPFSRSQSGTLGAGACVGRRPPQQGTLQPSIRDVTLRWPWIPSVLDTRKIACENNKQVPLKLDSCIPHTVMFAICWWSGIWEPTRQTDGPYVCNVFIFVVCVCLTARIPRRLRWAIARKHVRMWRTPGRSRTDLGRHWF